MGRRGGKGMRDKEDDEMRRCAESKAKRARTQNPKEQRRRGGEESESAIKRQDRKTGSGEREKLRTRFINRFLRYANLECKL